MPSPIGVTSTQYHCTSIQANSVLIEHIRLEHYCALNTDKTHANVLNQARNKWFDGVWNKVLDSYALTCHNYRRQVGLNIRVEKLGVSSSNFSADVVACGGGSRCEIPWEANRA